MADTICLTSRTQFLGIVYHLRQFVGKPDHGFWRQVHKITPDSLYDLWQRIKTARQGLRVDRDWWRSLPDHKRLTFLLDRTSTAVRQIDGGSYDLISFDRVRRQAELKAQAEQRGNE
jgi:hypothetical protein